MGNRKIRSMLFEAKTVGQTLTLQMRIRNLFAREMPEDPPKSVWLIGLHWFFRIFNGGGTV